MQKRVFQHFLKKEDLFGKINNMVNIKDILSNYKNIALVGASKDLDKTSTIVMKHLQNYGYKVYPVNPTITGQLILGERVYGKVSEIDGPVDIVDVFRPSKDAPPFASQAVKIKAKTFWLQYGIENDEAKEIVEKENIVYISNKCIKQEYQKLFQKSNPVFPVLKN